MLSTRHLLLDTHHVQLRERLAQGGGLRGAVPGRGQVHQRGEACLPRLLPMGVLCALLPGALLLHASLHLEGGRGWQDSDLGGRPEESLPEQRQ